jgi:2-dehydropantoate 2-reductase
MDIVVFGAGSLGSLVGGLLAAEHDVTLVGRNPHMSTVAAEGLSITGEVDREVTAIEATTAVPEATELVLLTTKAYDTAAAADALAGGRRDAVISLQNGLGNEELLKDRLSCAVLAGTCTYGARLVEPGVVECTGEGAIAFGPRQGGRNARADLLDEDFRGSEVDIHVATDMPRRLWEKLAVNAGINAATALARVDNGALVDGHARGVAQAAAREAALVARDLGVPVDPDEAVTAVLDVAEATAANVSSMRADVEAGSRTEIDAINGAVLDHTEGEVPVNETLVGLLRAWEAGQGHRQPVPERADAGDAEPVPEADPPDDNQLAEDLEDNDPDEGAPSPAAGDDDGLGLADIEEITGEAQADASDLEGETGEAPDPDEDVPLAEREDLTLEDLADMRAERRSEPEEAIPDEAFERELEAMDEDFDNLSGEADEDEEEEGDGESP